MSSNFANLVSGVLDASKATFGIDATYFAVSGQTIEIQGIFDNESVQTDLGIQGIVETQRPTLGIKAADISPNEPALGDKVQIGTKLYKVTYPVIDGQGGIKLILQLDE